MTIDMKCAVCKNPDRRRLVELGWNDGMDFGDIASGLEGVTATIVNRHVKQHAEGSPAIRQVDVEPVKPARERVLSLQKMQLDEVERRIALAKQTAARLNSVLDELEELGAEGASTTPRHDWSEFYDILSKDAQAAIGSILKTQGLADKRDKAQGDLKLGLFEAMTNAGLAPKALVGGKDAPLQLPDGDDDGD